MSSKFIKSLKVIALIVVGVISGILISSKFDIKISGLSSSASRAGEPCGLPPVLDAPPGYHWGCQCKNTTIMIGCRWAKERDGVAG